MFERNDNFNAVNDLININISGNRHYMTDNINNDEFHTLNKNHFLLLFIYLLWLTDRYLATYKCFL